MKLETMLATEYFNQVVMLNLVASINTRDPNKRVAWLARQYMKEWESGRQMRSFKNVTKNQRLACHNANTLFVSIMNIVDNPKV